MADHFPNSGPGLNTAAWSCFHRLNLKTMLEEIRANFLKPRGENLGSFDPRAHRAVWRTFGFSSPGFPGFSAFFAVSLGLRECTPFSFL